MSTDHLDPADTAPRLAGSRTRATCRSSPPGHRQRPGRVRGAFTMTPTPEPATAHPAVPVARALPRPFSGDLDWALVACSVSRPPTGCPPRWARSAPTPPARSSGTAAAPSSSSCSRPRPPSGSMPGRDLVGRGAGRAGNSGRGRPVRAGPAPTAGRRRPGGEHHHHRPRPGHPRADRRSPRARSRGGGQRPGADRLPGLPGLAQRGQRPPVLRGATAAAPAPGRRSPTGRRGVGHPAPVGGDPPAPAAPGHPGRPGRRRAR